MKVRLFCLLAFVVVISGCVEYSHTVDYFTVKTSPSNRGSKISTPLNIVLSDEVSDSMSTRDKHSEIELKLTDFRKTIGENLRQTLGKSFSKVSVSEKPDNEALNLVIHTIDPRLNSNSFTYKQKRTINYYLNFGFSFTLYKGEKEIRDWNSKTRNDYYATSTIFYTKLAKSGVRDMCEMISHEILSDPATNQFFALDQ